MPARAGPHPGSQRRLDRHPGRVLIGVAVVIGLVLLQVVDDAGGGGGGAASGGGGTPVTTAAPDGSSTTTTTTVSPNGARPPSQVVVQVLNGSGVQGAANQRSNDLKAKGYQVLPAGNAPAPRTGTAVQCKKGYEKEAQALVAALNDARDQGDRRAVPQPGAGRAVGPGQLPGHPGQVALARLASDAGGQAAFVIDFDGTLAPIVNDPAGARPLPAALDALARARRTARAGRGGQWPAGRLPARARAVRSRGARRPVRPGTLVDGEVVVDRARRALRRRGRGRGAEAEATWPDLFVERKGEIAFTIHWRTAPGLAPHADALADLAARHGLDTQPGRMACELRPPVPRRQGHRGRSAARRCVRDPRRRVRG